MSRLISLIVLLACIVIIGILFYKVMVGFFVPLFLAAVLVVVFRPLHRHVLRLVQQRDHVAAVITTLIITAIVLMPASFVATFAAIQGIHLVKSINSTSIAVAMTKGQEHFKLQQPGIDHIRTLDVAIEGIQDDTTKKSVSDLEDQKGPMAGHERTIREEVRMLTELYFEKLSEQLRLSVEKEQQENKDPESVEAFKESIELAKTAKREEIAKSLSYNRELPANDVSDDDAKSEVQSATPKIKPYNLPTDLEGYERLGQSQTLVSMNSLMQELDAVTPSALEGDPGNDADLIELQSRAVELGQKWQELRTQLYGGTTMGFIREIANPSSEQINTFTNSFIQSARPRLLELTGATGAFLVRLGIGTAIMVVSLFFFLYDGPAMIRGLMHLSPLDDRYEMELLTEFDRVVRAIVLALIASAIVQGLTAGIGYYAVGMPTLVFLILLTTLCALIPFVGPAIVWVPVCIYLAVYEERLWAAGLLALWGVFAVGSVDNVVKTVVLHGQSSLHPLFALLSILGGVQALGPIGIVVGPIVVALLQTLLGILQRELSNLDQDSVPDAEPQVTATGEVAVPVSEKGGFANMIERLRLRSYVKKFEGEGKAGETRNPGGPSADDIPKQS